MDSPLLAPSRGTYYPAYVHSEQRWTRMACVADLRADSAASRPR